MSSLSHFIFGTSVFLQELSYIWGLTKVQSQVKYKAVLFLETKLFLWSNDEEW